VGALDELRAQVALLRLHIEASGAEGAQHTAAFLWWLLHTLFVVGALCSDPLRKRPDAHAHELGPEALGKLEAEQARIEQTLALPRAFVASAANPLAAQADIACSVARRFERTFVRLVEHTPGFEAPVVLAFVNRLSDYLYVLARQLDAGEHRTADYSVL